MIRWVLSSLHFPFPPPHLPKSLPFSLSDRLHLFLFLAPFYAGSSGLWECNNGTRGGVSLRHPSNPLCAVCLPADTADFDPQWHTAVSWWACSKQRGWSLTLRVWVIFRPRHCLRLSLHSDSGILHHICYDDKGWAENFKISRIHFCRGSVYDIHARFTP